ncbi:hypothetical protein ABID14_000785 [Peptoniphilus olsenii]|uniref:SLH domain-containing protein n=1 Tax=Peptoniphilus olsenii TaxID=411570 RepID=A0ABV2J8Q7_9FIRM
MKNRIISLFLVFIFIFNLSAGVFAKEAVDNKNNIENKITKLLEKNIITGYPDKSLGLNRNITRAEILKTIVASLGFLEESNKLKGKNKPFVDVDENHWANGIIAWAKNSSLKNGIGIIHGYPDGTFKPENNITVAELITILALAAKDDVNLEDIKNANYPDTYINCATELKIIGPESGIKNINLDEKATRKLSFEMVYNFMQSKI